MFLAPPQSLRHRLVAALTPTTSPSLLHRVIPILNATVSLVFTTSVLSHLNSPSTVHPFICSACIVYFLGFYGIGFIDSHELQSRPPIFGLSDLAKKVRSSGCA